MKVAANELRWVEVEPDTWVTDCDLYSVFETTSDAAPKRWIPMFAPLGMEEPLAWPMSFEDAITACESHAMGAL